MSTATIDGISTRYEVAGSGPPLLMFSPGGFNAALENWGSFGIYARLNLLDHLTQRYACITFDRRESGRSGGRVQRVTWGANESKDSPNWYGYPGQWVRVTCGGVTGQMTWG